MLLNSGFGNGACCFTLNDCHTILSIIRTSVAEKCVLQKQWFYVSQELGTQQRMLSRSLLDRRHIDEERELGGEDGDPLWIPSEEDSRGSELEFVQSVSYVPHF